MPHPLKSNKKRLLATQVGASLKRKLDESDSFGVPPHDLYQISRIFS